ncbi:MAG TPA: nuclear transport factor 2 family protein [Actinomycetes bacterium]|nr:nuclear transport factor 2 family protein [Actinomycetes bacterium]
MTSDTTQGTEAAVLAAASDLVAAFAAHDRVHYFGSFAPEATFVFYTTPRVLASRQAYEQEWASWEAEGFRVLSCHSSDQRVDPVSETVAVFTHRVRTHVRDAGGEQHLAERETIVFRREPEGRWVAVHEHLSPDPGPQ